MISARRGASSLRNWFATSPRSLPSCGLVCNSEPLVCSIMLMMIGSNIALPPLSSTSSRPSATAAGLGCCASAAPASNWHASTRCASWTKDLAFIVVPLCFVSRPFDDAPAFRSGDHGRMGEPDEKPVFNHPRNAREPLGKGARIGDPLQGGIENEMAAVRDESMADLVAAQRYGAGTAGRNGRGFDRALGCGKAERYDLDRQRKVPEHRDPFRLVGDHDHAGRRRRDDLLA